MNVNKYLQNRKLDIYFELEEKLMNHQQQSDGALMQVLADADAGCADDKLRLFLMHYITANSLPDVSLVMLCCCLLVCIAF